MIIDSHCHPQFSQYDKDREVMLGRAFDAGVSMICVGTDLETSKQGVELARQHDNIWASVGLHPNDITDGFDVMAYHNILRNSGAIAIGEVGLDYYRTPEPEKQKKQKKVFEQFIDLAVGCNKPLIIHCRDSAKGTIGHVHQDVLSIVKSSSLYHDRDNKTTSKTGVMHSFTGTKENARKYLDLGFYLGFNGILTFARQYDEVVRYVPLENILLETDAPFLTPEPYRGQRNEPAYVVEVAKKVAELKNISIEKVIEQTTENCKKFFNLV